MTDIFSKYLSPIINGQALTLEQAQELINVLPQKFTALIAIAGIANQDTKPFVCSCINAKSGHCTEDCAYCAQSLYSTHNCPTHNVVKREILYEHSCMLAEKGIERMGIVSKGGTPKAADFEKLCKIAEKIVQKTNLKLCASFGILNNDQVKSIAQAGFTTYHLNLETSRSYFPHICTTHSYDVRINAVKLAQIHGLRTCSGGLFGMGESWEHRLDLCETLQKLNIDSIPINFLTPVAGTRMENFKVLKPQEALSIIAIVRLLLPKRDIVMCSGRIRNLGEWDRSTFFAGANGFNLNDSLTPRKKSLDRDLELLATLGLLNN